MSALKINVEKERIVIKRGFVWLDVIKLNVQNIQSVKRANVSLIFAQ